MNKFIELAEKTGFRAALLDVKDIPVDYSYRKYCEENTCGQYHSNYSCPPLCGSSEEMHARILLQEKAIVLQTVWPIAGYDDEKEIEKAKAAHIQAEYDLLAQLRTEGYDGFCIGAGNCGLCRPCRQTLGEECAFPEKRYSCMSAYCIDVEKISGLAGLEFAWDEHKLYAVGMIAFHKI